MVLAVISRNIWATPHEGATARITTGAPQHTDAGILLARAVADRSIYDFCGLPPGMSFKDKSSMTPDQKDALEAYEISNRAFDDAIELLQLIEVMQGQNKDDINAKLSEAGAAGAALVVRNGVQSRTILFLAGAYAVPRPGDLHLRRAFDLLKQPGVRNELGLRGSPTILDEAEKLWARCKSDHRLPVIKHYRDKFTAHLSTPRDDVALPKYDDVFSFAHETMKAVDTLARGTGARTESLYDWQEESARSAARFWSPWR